MGYGERSSPCFPESIIRNTHNEFFRILDFRIFLHLQTRWELILRQFLGTGRESLANQQGWDVLPNLSNPNVPKDPQEQPGSVGGDPWNERSWRIPSKPTHSMAL